MKTVRNRWALIAACSLAAWAMSSLVVGEQPVPTPNPAGTAAAKPTTEKKPVKTSPEIAAWIADLDVRQYRTREQATRQLLAAGPVAFDPLLAVANGDRPEPADRAVWLLQQFSNAGTADVRRAALIRLTQLKDRPQISAAAGDTLAMIRHREARLAIEHLGGRFAREEYPGIDPRAYSIPLILDEHWKGTNEDLALMNDVLGLRQVIVIGTSLPVESLSELQSVPMLEKVCLYGTRVEDNDLAALKKQLPQAEFDFRRGGLLGIKSSPPNTGVALVDEVQPDTAAAAAGIQRGDVIRKFNNQDVGDFKDLTEKIAQVPAGEEVTLDVVRNGATKKFKLKLGQWTAEQILNRQEP